MEEKVAAPGKKKSKETLIDASKEVGLETNIEKTKYIVAGSSPKCRPNSEHKNSKQIIMCHNSDIWGRQ
jgi:hypothetical protein